MPPIAVHVAAGYRPGYDVKRLFPEIDGQPLTSQKGNFVNPVGHVKGSRKNNWYLSKL